jgi:ubiquinone/menaquinone biosynthesis C-methylase UbiE
MYDQLKTDLRQAYDSAANERNESSLASWKIDERQYFLNLIQNESKESLLEIGAGPGKDSLFFKNQGLNVVSTDLSLEMVRLCRDKGLEAYQMDFQNLDFSDNNFDAVYAMNCLLHVPKVNLPAILDEIYRVLKPTGLFFMGVYGGFESEGIWENDHHTPKRFFSFFNDDQLIQIVSKQFAPQDFKRLTVPEIADPNMVFQRLILRKE